MTDNFTTKEMVTRLMNKLDSVDEKLDNIHSQTTATNSTVGLHTKMIWGAYGFTSSIFLFIITTLI